MIKLAFVDTDKHGTLDMMFRIVLFQFWERIKLYLMPAKHQPDFSFLRHVPLRRVHLFTLVQILCLAVLWILKSTFLAIIFPVMVSVLLFVLFIKVSEMLIYSVKR